MLEGRIDERELDRFWNDLTAGRPAPGGYDLDPAAMETVRAFRDLAAVPLDEATRHRIGREVRAAMERGALGPGKEDRLHRTAIDAVAPPGVAPNGRIAASPAAWRTAVGARRRGRWGLAQVATAALLLLTLGLVVQMLAPARPDGRPAAVPAPPATPATPGLGGVTEELLAVVELPAGAFSGDQDTWTLGRWEIRPGTRSTWTADNGACCPGPRIEHVLAGTYVVRAAGPVQVLRAGGGGAPEAVPAGAEVELRPGDTLVSRNETAFDAANPGTTPTDLLLASFLPRYGVAPVPQEWINRGKDAAGEVAAPVGAVTLRLRRVTLAPGAVLPAPRPGGVQLVVNPIGEPVVGVVHGKAQNVFDEPATVPVLTYEPAGEARGRQHPNGVPGAVAIAAEPGKGPPGAPGPSFRRP